MLLALAAAGLAALWWTRPAAVAERELSRVLEHLRARGVPTTFEEWCPPEPAPEDNGWLVITSAVQWRDAVAPEDWRSTIVGPWNYGCPEPWWETSSEEQMREAAAFLEEMAPFFERVETAVSKPHVRWPLEPPDETGERSVLEDVQRTSAVQQMLVARAHLASDEATRIRALVLLARLADRMEGRTTPLASLMRPVLLRTACGTLRTLLESGRIDGCAARSELDGLLTVRCIDEMPDVIVSERIGMCEIAPHVIDGTAFRKLTWSEKLNRAVSNVRNGRSPFAPALDVDPLLAVGLIDQLDAAAALDPSWDRAYDDAFVACFPRAPVNLRPDNSLHVRIENRRCVDALTRLARVALAACVHRGEHGDWPGGPEELAPLFPDGAVPVDPYTGEAFAWSVDGGVLTISARPWTCVQGMPGAADEDPADWNLVWTLR